VERDDDRTAIVNDRYVPSNLLSTTPLAEVWLGRDSRLGRVVRLRVLHPAQRTRASSVQRFFSQATACARIEHPGLLRLLDATPHPAVVVTEHIEARTLRRVVEEDGPLPLARAAAIMDQVAGALVPVHAAGMVHGHPGLDSIEVDAHDRAVLTDLGLRPLGPGVDPGDDVFGLTVTLAALVSGRPQADADGTELALDAVASLGAGAPPGLSSLVAAGLDQGAARQPADAAAWQQALRSVDTQRAPESPRDGFLRAERAWLVPALAVVVLAVVVAVAGFTGATDSGPFARRLNLAAGRTPQAATASAPDDREATAPEAEELHIAALVDYDPLGDGIERPDRLAGALDDDPSTDWTSESYSTSSFGNLKEGVGLEIRLDGVHEVTGIRLRTTSPGWAVRFHVSQGAPDDLAGWGDPLASTVVDERDGTTAWAPVRAASVLVWISDLGPALEGEHRVGISEIQVLGHRTT
jgi:hypothetical protein